MEEGCPDNRTSTVLKIHVSTDFLKNSCIVVLIPFCDWKCKKRALQLVICMKMPRFRNVVRLYEGDTFHPRMWHSSRPLKPITKLAFLWEKVGFQSARSWKWWLFLAWHNLLGRQLTILTSLPPNEKVLQCPWLT